MSSRAASRKDEPKMARSFAGAGVALVTPFTRDGALDEAALRRLVKRQVDGGIDVLVPCGTTGESVTLTAAETERVIAICLEESAGKPVLAGAGSNDTRTAIQRSKAAAALGRSEEHTSELQSRRDLVC